MGQTTDQIERHIEHKREDLKSNLRELETRAKSATDWRHYFKKHTWTMMAAAFSGGLLLARMLGKASPAGQLTRDDRLESSPTRSSGRVRPFLPRRRGSILSGRSAAAVRRRSAVMIES